jgi:hypothetical protein
MLGGRNCSTVQKNCSSRKGRFFLNNLVKNIEKNSIFRTSNCFPTETRPKFVSCTAMNSQGEIRTIRLPWAITTLQP